MIVSENLIGTVALRVRSSLTMSGLAPLGNMCAGTIPFLTSISTLNMNENSSKLKIRRIKLQKWITVITLLYERTLKQPMVDKRIDEKKANKLKNVNIHYLDKRKEIMKNAQFIVEGFSVKL